MFRLLFYSPKTMVRTTANGTELDQPGFQVGLVLAGWASVANEISKWLHERVEEIEKRHTDPADPASEDVRQLATSLRSAMGAAQELGPNVAGVFYKWAAKPFSQYPGYQASWDT